MDRVIDPSLALTTVVHILRKPKIAHAVWLKEKEIQRVRAEKHISFPEARELAEVKSPVVS